MALSSSPAKSPSATATASVSTSSTAVTTTPRLFTNPQPPWRDHPRPPTPPPQPPHYHHHRSNSYQLLPNLAPRIPSASIRPLPPPPQGILYPVASSGRGFLSKPPPIRPPQIQSSSDQAVTIANPGGFPLRSVYSRPPSGFPHLDLQSQALHMIRSNHLKHTLAGSTAGGGGVMLGKGVPVSSSHLKVAPSQPSVSDSNGRKDLRDRTRDDAFATVRDRKVRIYEGSLYAHCRSWLRNGYPEENQPLYVDGVKSLPKPLPTPVADTHLLVKKEGDKEEQEEEGTVEHFSPKDLLQRHIKRAKRVRARLREQRLQRIARYKSRLALLLPPLVEQQQFRNDMDDLGN